MRRGRGEEKRKASVRRGRERREEEGERRSRKEGDHRQSLSILEDLT